MQRFQMYVNIFMEMSYRDMSYRYADTLVVANIENLYTCKG